MTDAYTDELFALPDTTILQFPVSRLLVDVERFPNDTDEPMNKVGMGMLYTHTAYGKKLRRTLQPDETRTLVSQYYEVHHQRLLAKVEAELEKHGKALIVDCHSFPSLPLPCDSDQSTPRPQFCIGTDSFHTPEALIDTVLLNLEKMGYSVGINKPYAGALVPMGFYRIYRRVESIMIEVNRSLYMNELTGVKNSEFDFIKKQVQGLLLTIREFL